MARAVWNGQTIARSDDTVVVEGNHYFPRNDVDERFLRDSDTRSTCPSKGRASYYDVAVGNEVNRDAAWSYRDPKPAAAEIAGRIAFWRGVRVED